MSANSSKNLIRQGSFLILSSVLVRIINLVYRIPITNLWGDEGLGTYGDAYQVYSFFLVLSFVGVPSVISKLVGERLALDRHKDAKLVLTCGLKLMGAIGSVSMLIMVFGGNLIARGLYNNPDAALPLRFLGITVLVVSLVSVLRGYFQGMNNMRPTAISEIIEGLLHAAFAVILAMALFSKGMAWSVSGAIFGTLIGGIGALLFLAFCYILYSGYYTASSRKRQVSSPESSAQIYRAMLQLMIPIMLSSTIFSLKSLIDASMFSKLMELKGYTPELSRIMRGMYTGKFVLLINLPISLGDSLGAAAVPNVSASFAKGRFDELQEELSGTVRAVLLIVVPCSVGLAVLGKPILGLLFSHAPDGGELFYVGSFAATFYCLAYVATGVLNGLGKPRYAMYNALIGVAVTLLLNVVTILLLDLKVYALPLNSLVFSFLYMLLNMHQATRLCKVKLDLWRLFAGPLLCSLAMGLIALGVYHGLFALIHSGKVACLAALVVAVVSYFLIAVNSGVLSEEMMNLIPGGRYLRYLQLRKPV